MSQWPPLREIDVDLLHFDALNLVGVNQLLNLSYWCLRESLEQRGVLGAVVFGRIRWVFWLKEGESLFVKLMHFVSLYVLLLNCDVLIHVLDAIFDQSSATSLPVPA